MSHEPIDPLFLEQQDHERMKSWMIDHNWSVSLCADPADIIEFTEDLDDDFADSDEFYCLSTNL